MSADCNAYYFALEDGQQTKFLPDPVRGAALQGEGRRAVREPCAADPPVGLPGRCAVDRVCERRLAVLWARRIVAVMSLIEQAGVDDEAVWQVCMRSCA